MDVRRSPRRTIFAVLTAAMQAAMLAGLILFIIRKNWENAFLSALVILLTLVPAFLTRRYRISVPPEFQIIAVAFVFMSLFLGSASDFYERYWWWDIVLHTSSGFLLGVVGWLSLFLLNQTDRLPEGIKPGFVAFFGVTFAVTLGVLWEIWEFAVDRLLGKNMQRTETGVADTMQDLIVTLIGAIVVAMMGWAYSRTGRYSFLIDAIRGFMRRNPHLFGQRKSRERRTRPG